MKISKIVYAFIILAFSSLSQAGEFLESSRETTVKNRIEEIRVSMINSQVELDKLKSELSTLRHSANAEFFRIKLEKQETFDKDTLKVLPMINDEELNYKIFNHYIAYERPTEETPLFFFLVLSVSGFFLLGLVIHRFGKSKEQELKVML